MQIVVVDDAVNQGRCVNLVPILAKVNSVTVLADGHALKYSAIAPAGYRNAVTAVIPHHNVTEVVVLQDDMAFYANTHFLIVKDNDALETVV